MHNRAMTDPFGSRNPFVYLLFKEISDIPNSYELQYKSQEIPLTGSEKHSFFNSNECFVQVDFVKGDQRIIVSKLYNPSSISESTTRLTTLYQSKKVPHKNLRYGDYLNHALIFILSKSSFELLIFPEQKLLSSSLLEGLSKGGFDAFLKYHRGLAKDALLFNI